MKKNLTILFSLVLIFGFGGVSTAGFMPYGIGDVTDFLGDATYFNGYTEITDIFRMATRLMYPWMNLIRPSRFSDYSG